MEEMNHLWEVNSELSFGRCLCLRSFKAAQKNSINLSSGIPGNLHIKWGTFSFQQHTSKFYPRPSHDFSLRQHEDSGS